MKNVITTLVCALMALAAHAQSVLQVETKERSAQCIYAEYADISFWGLPSEGELNSDLKISEISVSNPYSAYIQMDVTASELFENSGAVGICITAKENEMPDFSDYQLNEKYANSNEYEISDQLLQHPYYRFMPQESYRGDNFRIHLNQSLDPGRTYYVKPFARYGEDMYMGSEKSFTMPWTLSAVLANYFPWYQGTEIPDGMDEFIVPTDKAWEDFCNKYKKDFGVAPSAAVMQALTTAWFNHLTPAEVDLMKGNAVAHYDNCVDGDVYIVDKVCDELFEEVVKTTGDIDLTKPNLKEDNNGRALYTRYCQLDTEDKLGIVGCDVSYGIEGNQYVKIEPTAQSVNPMVGYDFPFLLLPNRLYNVSVTIAPNTEDVTDERPSKFYVNVFNYGNTVSTRIANPVTSTDGVTDYYFIYGGQKLETFTFQIDTHDQKFASPTVLQLYSQITSRQTSEYSRTIRIAKINVSLVVVEPLEWKFEAGWNWVSSNRRESINSTELFEAKKNILEVKSQTKGLVRDTKYGMVGNLTRLVATEAYKVKISEADAEPCQLEGYLFDAATNGIYLKQGWNWIGYPMANEAPIEDALKKFAPLEGDYIVDQEDFTSYNEGEWKGTLTKLTPGKGYMYKSGETRYVQYSKVAEAKPIEAKARTDSEESQWTCDIHKYPNRMPAIARLYIKDVEADLNDYDVAAFCGDECRGVGKVMKGVLMMNVCGEGNETITFKAIDKKSSIVMDIKESVAFTGDVLGGYTEPFKLTLDEEAVTGIATIQSNTDTEAIFNMAGQRIATDMRALPKGVYLQIKNGKSQRVFVK